MEASHLSKRNSAAAAGAKRAAHKKAISSGVSSGDSERQPGGMHNAGRTTLPLESRSPGRTATTPTASPARRPHLIHGYACPYRRRSGSKPIRADGKSRFWP
ncbi:hypothetical protein AAFF_G00395110 [Aldrovandia affinis]|uniref:Uncharacterized protein n=1 Tax=Aldrovandia affinis TaxID=143900 RepID=A0AAD7SDW0_9TELE|nr:hypothetical protein AAFF_G00395110 [Aldrovandia affinis]